MKSAKLSQYRDAGRATLPFQWKCKSIWTFIGALNSYKINSQNMNLKFPQRLVNQQSGSIYKNYKAETTQWPSADKGISRLRN